MTVNAGSFVAYLMASVCAGQGEGHREGGGLGAGQGEGRAETGVPSRIRAGACLPEVHQMNLLA